MAKLLAKRKKKIDSISSGNKKKQERIGLSAWLTLQPTLPTPLFFFVLFSSLLSLTVVGLMLGWRPRPKCLPLSRLSFLLWKSRRAAQTSFLPVLSPALPSFVSLDYFFLWPIFAYSLPLPSSQLPFLSPLFLPIMPVLPFGS